MVGSALQALIKSKMIAYCGSPTNSTELDNMCKAIGEAVVEYIQASAQTNAGQHVTVSLLNGQGATDQPGTIS